MEELGVETENMREDRPTFTLQWHLTTACPNYCKHCYMDRNSQILSLEASKKIIDDFKSLLERWNCNGRIHFTGGDPLLYPYFFKLLNYARAQIPNMIIGILGNPELLTEKTIEVLKEQDINFYQMSIDGLENTHDFIRYRGSFKETIRKIRLLKEYDVRTVVMSTASKLNLNEIPQLIDIMASEEIDLFGFHRFVPMGNGDQLRKVALISPQEYRCFLLEIYKKYKEYGENYTFWGRGEPLWFLLESEIGEVAELTKGDNENLIYSGCSIGCSHLCILNDGIVLPCRKLPIPIGKIPDQKIRDIFIHSGVLNNMRGVEKLEKCKNCELLQQCRGCRAMSYAIKGDYFASDPYCWK